MMEQNVEDYVRMVYNPTRDQMNKVKFNREKNLFAWLGIKKAGVKK